MEIEKRKFKLKSKFKPMGDQPEAIAGLVNGIEKKKNMQTLLGVTGSGKTFTMANVIAKANKPTLIIAHNKTLAAQLYSEFKQFFPNNAVEYFVSYYDYYQPESYIPQKDQYIEKDAALTRRFQTVLVEEPSVEDTISILRGLKEKYEVHHGVDITDPAIVAAATLSQRYITDRQLPDKAIDLVDEAASRIRMEIDSKPEQMDRLERRLIQLKIEREALQKESDEASVKRLENLQEQIDKLEREFSDLEEIWKAEKAAVQGSHHIKEELERARKELDTAQRAGDLARAGELQYGRIPELEKQLNMAAQAETQQMKLLRNKVTDEEIAEVVSKWTGIPVSKMLEGEVDKLLTMEKRISTRVVGQQEAITAVAGLIWVIGVACVISSRGFLRSHFTTSSGSPRYSASTRCHSWLAVTCNKARFNRSVNGLPVERPKA